MRDIRADLRERLKATEKERAHLEERERRLRALLADEEEGDRPRNPTPPVDDGGVRLRELVLGSLKDGHDWTLKEHAQGVGMTTFGALGRSLNITLVNLLRRGIVTRLRDGRWRLGDQGTQLPLDLEPPATNPDQEDGHAQVAS